MPTYAEWVSTLALGLSLISTGWQIAKARQERPRVGIAGSGILHFTHEKGLPINFDFEIAVTNYGGSAVTVTGVSWQREKEPGAYSVARALNPEDPAYSPDLARGPQLPYRLQPADRMTWTVTEEFMQRFTPREKVRPLVEYVNRPKRRFFRRSPDYPVDYGQWLELPEFGKTLEELDTRPAEKQDTGRRAPGGRDEAPPPPPSSR